MTAPPTTTTTVPRPPPLPSPTPIRPLVSPSLPGEGDWQAATVRQQPRNRSERGYRPVPRRGAAGSNWPGSPRLRHRASPRRRPPVRRYRLDRLGRHPHGALRGTSERYGTWPQQGGVTVSQLPSLLAGFNSGFKLYSYDIAWYDQGRTAVPLRAGAASLVIFANGTATVADWGRDVGPGPTVDGVRHSLTLLVDYGIAAPTVGAPSQWGAVLGGGTNTWRSGVGVTAAGDLVYAGGADLDPAGLARLLIAVGAMRAMGLDINPEWVSFATFTHAGGIAGTGVIGAANLLAGTYLAPGHYLQPFSRDFFAVFAR